MQEVRMHRILRLSRRVLMGRAGTLLEVRIMTVRYYICLCCDSKPGDLRQGAGTLRRIRPHKIYICMACIKQHGGLPIASDLPHLMQAFQERRKREIEPLKAETLPVTA